MKAKIQTCANLKSALAGLFLLLTGAIAVAQSTPSPFLIPFQGRLTNPQGVPYTNGQFTIIFNLYDQPVGGALLWSETHQKVGVINGMVNVFLGSINPALSNVDFSRTLHLGITIDADGNPNTPDPEMVPRQMIIPAFWAKNSEKLNGYDWTPVFGVNSPSGPVPGNKIQPLGITDAQIAGGAVMSPKIADGAVTSPKIADGAIGLQALAPSVSTMLVPPGTIVPFAGPANRIPQGWLLCDGNNLSRTDTNYQALFQAIGTSWGAPNGNEFNLPDLRGLFLRGVDNASVNRDPDRDARTSLVPNGSGNTGVAVGSFQSSTNQSHQHRWSGTYINATRSGVTGISVFLNGSAVGGAPDVTGPGGNGTLGNAFADNDSAGSIRPSGGSESRPVNAYVNYIIKY